MKVDPFTDPSEITSEMTSRMIFAYGAMRMPLLTVFAAFMLDMQGVAQLPVLNELMTSNQTAFQDDVPPFDFDDWVEIYNPGGLVQLAGYHISDDRDNLTKYTFPDTDPMLTYLAPGEHKIVWLDKDSVQGVLHANFKLSSENEGLWLTAQDGVTVVDSIVYPPQQTDISYGRACDGCEAWEFFNVPTPEEVNAQTTLPTANLYINEVLLQNGTVLVDEFFEFAPWVEVFNPNGTQVNLGGYVLSTSLGVSATIPMDDPVETTVPAEGFLLLWLDGEPEEGGHHLDMTVSPEDQVFTLTGPDMQVSDEFEALTFFDNVSYGRELDGGVNSMWFDIPTPRVTNGLIVIPPGPVVINECQSSNSSTTADGFGDYEDWIEIHNTGDAPINLAGYHLTDRLSNPTKWTFPFDAGGNTVVEPGGYMLLWADEDGGQGWNHTNFKLNNEGEALVLRSPDGFTIADSVHFGTGAMDQSYARQPDAIGPFEWVQDPTPGECNGCPETTVNVFGGDESWFLGANPCQAGASIWLDMPATLWTLNGQKIADLGSGTQMLPQGVSGPCILRSEKGGIVKLTMLQE